MTEKTKQYKISFFFPPVLDQQKLEETIQNTKKWIINKGGSVLEEETPLSNIIKKRLAYPIKKYQEAFYLFLNLEMPVQLIDEFCRHLNLEKDILRYLISIKEKPAQAYQESPYSPPMPKAKPAKETIDLKMIDKIEPLPTETKPIEGLERKISPPAGKEKVKIEELDKKLEEILNE